MRLEQEQKAQGVRATSFIQECGTKGYGEG